MEGCNMSRGGSVEGQAVKSILLDTGCSKTLVRRDLVPEGRLVDGKAVTIRCAHGDTVLYPVANVTMEVEGIPRGSRIGYTASGRPAWNRCAGIRRPLGETSHPEEDATRRRLSCYPCTSETTKRGSQEAPARSDCWGANDSHGLYWNRQSHEPGG